MPIMILKGPDRSGPVVVCDFCGKRIDNAQAANYEWDDNDKAVGELIPIYLLHKDCSSANESRHGDLLDSMEMIDLVPFLADNLHLDWDVARKHSIEMSQDLE